MPVDFGYSRAERLVRMHYTLRDRKAAGVGEFRGGVENQARFAEPRTTDVIECCSLKPEGAEEAYSAGLECR